MEGRCYAHAEASVGALCSQRSSDGWEGACLGLEQGPGEANGPPCPPGQAPTPTWPRAVGTPPPQPSACVPKPLPPCPAQAELHRLQEHQQSKSTRLLNRLYLLYQILPNFLFYLLIPSASLSPKECTSFFKARWEGLTVHLILRLPIALSSTPGHA